MHIRGKLKNITKIKFENLHCHTAFSFYDGLGFPIDYARYLSEIGCGALSITDHGNMGAFSYQFEAQKELKKEGIDIKNIYGSEMYFIPSIEKWRKENEKSGSKSIISNKAGIVESEERFSKDISKSSQNRRHLLVLARNRLGLRNLFAIVSRSYRPGNFYRKPRFDFGILRRFGEGLIITSACIGGVLGECYYHNQNDKENALKDMERVIHNFYECVGRDNFYGELQWHYFKEQHIINQLIIEASKRTGLKLISATDAHMPTPELWKDRQFFKRLSPQRSKAQKERDSQTPIPKTIEELDTRLWPKNGQEIFEEYKKTSQKMGFEYDDNIVIESFENAYDIAHNIIEDYEIDTTINMPSFILEGKNAYEEIKKQCDIAIKRFAHKNNFQDYKLRMEKELEVIKSNGFCEYFYTMKEISDISHDNMICGAGRGSAAGCLVSYLLDITQVDPLKYDLLFERFMTKGQKGFPDIDFDVADKDKIREELVSLWGKNNVVAVSNYNRLKLRSLIKDVSKYYDIPFPEVNAVTSVMENEAKPFVKEERGIISGAVQDMTLEEVYRNSKSLQKFFNSYPEVQKKVTNLYSSIKSVGRHAGGLIIADNIPDKMPVIYSDGVFQTSWSEGQHVRHLEPLGWIKFDLLGLKTLFIMQNCIRKILKREGKEESVSNLLDFYNKKLHPDILQEEEKVFKHIFHDGKFVGIFQFTSPGMQSLCMQAKPKTIEDITAITSIYRPGPLGANVHNLYVAAENGELHVDYKNDIIKKILQNTHGNIIYQEQLALLAHKLGDNITLEEGNKLRKILIKKGQGDKAIEKENIRQKFVKGCVEKDLTKRYAEELWQKMEYFSQYGFCKCLHEDTTVETKSGIKKIKDVSIGECVNSKNGFVKVKNKFKNGKKKVFKIKTSSGKELICTLDHKIETENGMKTLEEVLKTGEKVLVKT